MNVAIKATITEIGFKNPLLGLTTVSQHFDSIAESQQSDICEVEQQSDFPASQQVELALLSQQEVEPNSALASFFILMSINGLIYTH